MTTTFRLTAMAFAALMLGACGVGDVNSKLEVTQVGC